MPPWSDRLAPLLDRLRSPALQTPLDWKAILAQARGLGVRGKKVEGVVGMSLQPDGIGMAHMTFPGGPGEKPRLLHCQFHPLAAGQSPGRVAAAMVKARKLEKARFAGVLDRGSYVLFPAEAPDLPREEWASAMRWRIKEQIEFPPAQAVIEVFDMPGPIPDRDSGRIYVAVARGADVRRHVNLFLDGGLNLTAIDIPELALRNLAAGLADDREGMALLHLEAGHGLVLMLKKGRFYLSRRIEIGLHALLESLVDASEEDLPRAISNSRLVDQIALEAQRTMDYFESHFSQASAVSLHIAPLVTPIPGLRQALAERLGMRVKEFPLQEVLDLADGIDEREAARVLLALGAALGERGGAA
ncbi:MAG: hypothetical protein HQM03_14230 [Magnetococcales bacterium]|nr:hypothetical protein [Magnetococcales bacterium]